MTAWKTAAAEILHIVSGRPGSSLEQILIAVIALALCIVAIRAAARALHFPMAELERIILVILAAVTACLAAAVATQLYAVPALAGKAIALWTPALAATGVLLAAIVPLACFLFKSKYTQTTFALLIGIGAVILSIFMVRATADALRQGGKGASKARDKKESVNAVLNGK